MALHNVQGVSARQRRPILIIGAPLGEHEGMAEQPENVEYAGAAVASPLRQRNAEDLPDVTM